jgi:tetratricopeptide (TPR) repeat protein
MDYYGFMLTNKLISRVQARVLDFVLIAPLFFLLLPGANAQTSEPATAPGALAAGPVATGSAVDPGNSSLDAEMFYQLILGELNVFGGEPASGYSLLLDAARKNNDERLYERAVNIALQSRSGEPALQAARSWAKAFPASREANRYVLQILVGLNRLGDTLVPLKNEIAGAPTHERVATISSIPRLYARAADKKMAAHIVEQALGDSLSSPVFGSAAWTAVGRMRVEAGDPAGVLVAAQKAIALDANAEGPAMLALSVMGPKLPEAEQILKTYLQGKPNADVRMAYTRVLLDALRYPEALVQLRTVTADKPDHPQAWLVKGTLDLQEKNLDAAEQSLKHHLSLAQNDGASAAPEVNSGLTQAYLGLSQIAEQRKDFSGAEGWLARINNADDLVSAQSRRAALLAKQGRLDDGRKLLQNLPGSTPAEARLKLVAEVQFLRDNKQTKTAYDLLVAQTQAAEPDFELLYDQAMLAEKLGHVDEMERLLRQIIAAKPDYQHAYNALGYSLAERKVRLPEAKQLILKALEFSPNDPFITDSLGWVEFRIGNNDEALRILQSAFSSKPDAEIAAHLGEVLWTTGKKEQAIAIWREGAAINADNETLLETLKRLRVKL